MNLAIQVLSLARNLEHTGARCWVPQEQVALVDEVGLTEELSRLEILPKVEHTMH